MQVDWCTQPTGAIAQAIEIFKLKSLGWRGFEELDWVKAIHFKYPLVREIALKCSSIRGTMIEEVLQLIASAKPEDKPIIQSFFVCKLALEELSCRMNGAGAGMCDKRAAYMEIFHTLAKSV